MIVIDKWQGLITNASPYAIASGAAVTQVNVQVIVPGQLTVRPGMVAATWSSLSAGTSPVRRVFRAPCGGSERLIYQDAAGIVRAGTGPA
jgi:hypothetical protein